MRAPHVSVTLRNWSARLASLIENANSEEALPLLIAGWGLALAAALAAAAAGVDNTAQLWLSGSVIAYLVLFRNRSRHGVWRIAYLFCLTFITIRYFIW